VMPLTGVPPRQPHQHQPMRQQQGMPQAHRAIKKALVAAGLAARTARTNPCKVGAGGSSAAGAAASGNAPAAVDHDEGGLLKDADSSLFGLNRAVPMAPAQQAPSATQQRPAPHLGPASAAAAAGPAAHMPGVLAQDSSQLAKPVSTHATGTKHASSRSPPAPDPKQPKQHAGAGPSAAARYVTPAAITSKQQTGQQLSEHQLLHQRLHSMWGHAGELTTQDRNSRSLAHVVRFTPVHIHPTPAHAAPVPSLIQGAAALRALLEAGARTASVD
jgi:hypothetical protein